MKKTYPSLGLGDYRFFESNQDSVMIFNRFSAGEEILAVFNFSDSPTIIPFNHENYRGKKLIDLFTGKELTFDSDDHIDFNLGYYDFKWYQIQ